MRQPLIAFAISLGVALNGCTEHQEPPPVAPENLSALLYAGNVIEELDTVWLSWTLLSTEGEVEIAMRVGVGSWQPAAVHMPATVASTSLTLGPPAIEGAVVAFRARHVVGGASSSWSPEASVQRPVRAASYFWAAPSFVSGGPIVNLYWTRESVDADGIRLERQVRPVSGPPSTWTALPVSVSATSYADVAPPGWVDLARCVYRLTFLVGAVESAPVEQDAGEGPLVPPGDVVAEVVDGTVHLRWVNRSTVANAVEVVRSSTSPPSWQVWSLPGDATALDDPGLAPGLYGYSVRAFLDPLGQVSDPAPEAFAAVPAPTFDAAWAVRAVVLPSANGAARTASGDWALALGVLNVYETRPASGFAPEAGLVPYQTPPGYQFFYPGPLLDSQGRVHFIVAPARPTAPATATHVWREGGSWHEESVATVAPQLSLWTFSAGVAAADDSVHAAWRLADGMGIAWASNRNGAFEVEEVRPIPGTPAVPASPLALDPAGEPLMVLRVADASPRSLLLWRAAGGWVIDEIPEVEGSAPVGIPATPLLAGPGGAVHWTYPSATGWQLRERSGGAWLPPQPLALNVGAAEFTWAALSPDGSRLAVASAGEPTVVLVRASGGQFEATPLLETLGALRMGFSPSGKLWLLGGLSVPLISGEPAPRAYVLYEER